MEIIFGKAYEIKGFIILTGLPGKRHRGPTGSHMGAVPREQPNQAGGELRERGLVGKCLYCGLVGVHKQRHEAFIDVFECD